MNQRDLLPLLVALGAFAVELLSCSHPTRAMGSIATSESEDKPNTYFGRIVAGAPDCDGDGVQDFAVGLGRSFGYAGALRFYSGKRGELLYEVKGARPWDLLGGSSALPMADLDGDGGFEIAAALGLNCELAMIIFPSGSRQPLTVAAPAESLVSVADLNEDGVRDLMACRGSSIYRFSGKDGTPLADLVGPGPESMVLARMVSDPARPMMMGFTQSVNGECRLFDLARSLTEPTTSFRHRPLGTERLLPDRRTHGLWIANLDDDGTPDIISLVLGRSRVDGSSTGGYQLELTTWTSSAMGTVIARAYGLQGDAPPLIASSLALARDLNGDGISDIVLGIPRWFPSEQGGVLAMSGRDGAELWRISPLQQKGSVEGHVTPTGVTVDMLGDVDGDGVDDAIVGCGFFAYDQLDYGTGAVLVVSGRSGGIVHEKYESRE